MIEYLAVGIPLVLVVGYLLLTIRNFLSRPKNAPPMASVGIPIIGNYLEFAKNPVAFIEKCYRKYGNIYTVPMLHKNLTFLLGPEVSAPFYQLPDDKMSQNEVYRFMTPVFGEGVVYDAEPKKRVQQMQSMAQALKSGRLKVYVDKIEKETRNYLKEHFKESGTINLLEALSELTILTSSRCLHGDDVRENLFADVARIYYDLDKGVTPLSFFFPYAPTAAHKKRDAAREEMVRIFTKVIKARRDAGAKANESTNADILQVYIDFIYRGEEVGLTETQIVGLLIALLFAGQHTSSITSTWTTMFLLHNPRCLKEVLKEQEAILSKKANGLPLSSVPLDFDTVGEMEYLTNCVKEALRMFPPLIMLMRMALDNIETVHEGKKYVIPKGDIVITSPAVSSRLEDVFKNPNAFEPERFGPDREEHKRPFAYLGFGGGRHACLGQQFGILQVKTIMSVLLRTYSFELIDSEMPEPDYTAMVVGPKNHLMVKYKKL